MSAQPDSGLGDAVTQEFEQRREWLSRHAQPLDEEMIQLLMTDLELTLAKCNRICNLLLNQQKGLGEGVTIPLNNIKVSLSEIKWFMEQRPQNVYGSNKVDDLRALVEHHIRDRGPLGDAARSLYSIFLPSPGSNAAAET